MGNTRFGDQLNVQIGNEFEAHQQYISIAVYYDALTLPNMAAYYYQQALEERGHAMMMVKFLIDTDQDVRIPAVPAPAGGFADLVAPVALALEHERRVTQQIHGLARIAREDNDFAAEQFMQWFIKEQVEEVASADDMLRVVTRARDDLQYLETYAGARAASTDATAPAPAGA